MKKILLLTSLVVLLGTFGFSQTGKFWSANHEIPASITKDKAVSRLTYPKEFKLFNLDLAALRQELFTVVGNASRHSTVISLPNSNGETEEFEVFEASNFEPDLQAQFPEIRAYSGKGITDKYATLKLSISPQGIETMIFRTGKPNEFIEPFSQDHAIYSVFRSRRSAGQLPWTCSTQDEQLSAGLTEKIITSGFTTSSTGQLKTMRLAQSVNAEYSNYFGATSAAQVALVLAAVNNTLTRCNGCYEKDLAVHLNLIAASTSVFYYNTATDPYDLWSLPYPAGLSAWNGQLQATLTSVIGEANYDIGHLFGAAGGGGNAGCIGCVCVDGQKGSGITSPADGIPMGDNFDIDYVVHEVGHQMGANHTFSFQRENGSTVQKEVGSGISIMGYAGITGEDDSSHSIAYYHETSIAQIQTNLATKTCPVTTDISANNATPVVAAVNNYTIPISTPFALTGSATDANATDALTYQWEQDDNMGQTQTGAASMASATKASGPNWLSFNPTISPARYCPRLTSILAGALTTTALPGGNASYKVEALSSVSRALHFRLTVRDNAPYSSTAPVKVGQTAFTNMTVTVTNTSGPFQVTQPNTNVSWQAGSTQTITWDVANTTTAPVSCANVKISLSIDGGYTWPIVLSPSTANDGTETVTIPNNVTNTARVVIESVGNIFFDISNTNFTITAPAAGYSFNSVAATTVPCGSTTAVATLATTVTGTFTTPINLVATGNPVGTTVTFGTNPLTPGNSTTVTLNNVNTLSPGTYSVTVTGTAGSVVQTATLSFVVQPGSGPGISAQPVPATVCTGSSASFNAVALGSVSYQWQVSTDGGVTFTDIPGATNPTYTIPNTAIGQNGNQYQAVISTFCGSTTSNAVLLTVNAVTVISAQPPADVSVCAGVNNTFTVAAAGSGLTYQWQMSPTGCNGTFTDIPGATSASYTLTGITLSQDGSAYQVIVTGACGNLTSTCSALHVSGTIGILTQPTDLTACSGTTATFTVAASGTGVNYQWQVSTDGGITFTDIPGATAATLSITNVPATSNGNQYQVLLTNSSCTTPSTSAIAILTVNQTAAFSTQPQSANVCEGTDVTFTGAAVGTAVSYQWSVSTDGGTTYTPVAGATSASLTITGVTAAMNNNLYQLTITNTCAPAGVASNAATLTVDLPASITTQPSATAACEGSTASFTATVSGTGNLQWQVSTDNGVTFTDVPGATGATLTLPSVTADMNNHIYQLVVNGCNSITSTQALLTVNALPVVVITASPYVSLTTGLTTTLTATSTPPASVFSWYKNDVQVAGVTGNTIEVNHDELGAYKAVATDANGCSNTSGVLTITDSLVNIAFIYPNPNGGSFHVRFQGIGFNGQPRIISMYDAKGARVFSQDYVVTIPYQVMDVNAAKLSKGTYVLVLSDVAGNTLGTGKVVLR